MYPPEIDPTTLIVTGVLLLKVLIFPCSVVLYVVLGAAAVMALVPAKFPAISVEGAGIIATLDIAGAKYSAPVICAPVAPPVDAL